MHYITFLYERTRRSIRSSPSTIKLRGYDTRAWVDAEFYSMLPVNALAYDTCPTSRDIYLGRVIQQRTEETWERYKGRVIDKIYKLIHEDCREYASTSTARNFDLYNYLIVKSDDILERAKENYDVVLRALPQMPTEEEITNFDLDLKKIIQFEVLITSARMDCEIARVRAKSTRRIFDLYFDFKTDYELIAPHQGFTTPATPDFIYRQKVMGDIKSGKWYQFLEYTVVAYALAYEEHIGDPMDFGVILHVDLPRNRLVPTHYNTNLLFLDDNKRKRFFALRDRKLQIVAYKNDPGTPANKNDCYPECSYLSSCWEGA